MLAAVTFFWCDALSHTQGYSRLLDSDITDPPPGVCAFFAISTENRPTEAWKLPALGYCCYVFTKPTFYNAKRSDPGIFFMWNVRRAHTGSSVTHLSTLLCNRKEFPLKKKRSQARSNQENFLKFLPKISAEFSAWVNTVFSRSSWCQACAMLNGQVQNILLWNMQCCFHKGVSMRKL